MLFMESYVCYCSVRLGVIIVGLLSIVRSLVLSIVLFVQGVQIFEPIIDLLEHDGQYKNNKWVRKGIGWVERTPENVLIFMQVICYVNIVAALLGILGAIKLQKWIILPLALYEFVFFLSMTSGHIVFMIMLKKVINLGLLIVLTLVGSFVLLFFGYNCITCLAMFQIITLVKSTRYRELYGNDPFHPLSLSTNSKASSVQQLQFYSTPDDTDIDEQKRLARLGQWPRRQPPPTQVISVIPVGTESRHMAAPQLKWWQQQALDVDDKMLDSAIYRNWQRDELLRGVGGEVERKNALNKQYGEHWRRY
ncbi:uncharacterized protein LOC115629060 [Scaptodrosophila lebanonensis]|uniref:Uncharacterized protein LOC115629060 n=1 Tax=Drosophila lebanonensis TaxID=7225 RepID=A0A6J2TXG8_DROLE|nr:uncharacterized protein LOC115629060 [Scaptodrosophila lebanonensis]